MHVHVIWAPATMYFSQVFCSLSLWLWLGSLTYFLVISTSTRIDEQSVQSKIPVLTAITCLKRKGLCISPLTQSVMSMQAFKVSAVSLQLVSMETLHLILVVPFVIPMQVGFMQIYTQRVE